MGRAAERFNFNNPFQIATSLFSFARVGKSELRDHLNLFF